jgi:hypothetical protein
MTAYIVQLIVGAILVLFAMPLSVRYNAGTTRIRELQNRAPTPEMLATNTRIFARILRFFGAFLVLLSLLMIVGHRA